MVNLNTYAQKTTMKENLKENSTTPEFLRQKSRKMINRWKMKKRRQTKKNKTFRIVQRVIKRQLLIQVHLLSNKNKIETYQ